MKDPSVVRICSAQIASIWEEPAKTLEKARFFIRHAASSGAALICFPEQFATGWDPESGKNLEDTSGLIVSSLREYARTSQIAVIGSFRNRGDPLPKNTAVVIDKDGRILVTYSKMHLFSPGNEQNGFSPGSDLGIFTLGPFTCGIAICYDLRFPDLFRIYAQKGVQVVFVPAAWPQKRISHWELFITARAAENQIYVAGVNTTGVTPVDTYSGSSMTNNAEQLVFADLDPALVETARRSFPVEQDRKDALYRALSR
jgi:omega-amidase